MEKHSNNNAASLQVLQRDSLEKMIKVANDPFALQIYKKAFPDEVIEHFYLYPKTQEGMVAEVNHQPTQRHRGEDKEILKKRNNVYELVKFRKPSAMFGQYTKPRSCFNC